MAFAKGNESTEGNVRKLYIGVASSRVLAVNPNKAELEKLRNITLDEEPVYAGEVENTDGSKVRQVRITFYVKPDSSKYVDSEGKPVDTIIPVTFFLRDEFRKGSNSGKYKVIDKYGRTAWATEEDIEAKRIPMYSSGPANISQNYRKAYLGEEELVNFLIAYLNIPSCQKLVNGTWVMKPENELPFCEALLDNIKDYFKGDVSELKGILALQPTNTLKICFGVRSNDDGRMFQAVYTRKFLFNYVNDYSKLSLHINESQSNGAFPSTEFDTLELHEYKVKSTTFNETPSESGSSDDIPW